MALLAASLGISITSVVLGATNLNSNCTGISQIPAYLITGGVLGIVVFLLKCCDKDNEEDSDEDSKKENGFLNLIHMAQFGVLIWGSVILFGKSRPDCDTVLYDYAFAITLAAYALLALFILVGCCTFGVVFCKACAEHCCGDGEGELTYNCHCCGMLICADEITRANYNNAKAAVKSAATTKTTGKPIDFNKSYEEMRRACDVLDKTDVVINMEPLKKTTSSGASSDA
jgi:hypothetical protein